MSICDTLDCDTGLPTISTPECGGIDYGRKIVRLFVGELDANPFASTSSIQTLADWQTRLAEPSTGNTQVRLISVGYIYDGVKPEPENETQESWSGNMELIDSKQKVEGFLKKFVSSSFEDLNKLRCQPGYVFWYVTDKDWIFGGLTGFQNGNIMIGNLEHPGLGNGSNRMKVSAEWRSKDDTTPYYSAGISKLLNTAN